MQHFLHIAIHTCRNLSIAFWSATCCIALTFDLCGPRCTRDSAGTVTRFDRADWRKGRRADVPKIAISMRLVVSRCALRAIFGASRRTRCAPNRTHFLFPAMVDRRKSGIMNMHQTDLGHDRLLSAFRTRPVPGPWGPWGIAEVIRHSQPYGPHNKRDYNYECIRRLAHSPA